MNYDDISISIHIDTYTQHMCTPENVCVTHSNNSNQEELDPSNQSTFNYLLNLAPETKQTQTNIKKHTHTHIMGKEAILEWAQQVTGGYPQVNITDFSYSFADGYAFAAIVHYHNPELLHGADFDTEMSNMSREERLEWAFSNAESLGVVKYLEVEDVNEKRPDDKSVMLYISALYKHYNGIGMGRRRGTDSIEALIAASEKKRKNLASKSVLSEKREQSTAADATSPLVKSLPAKESGTSPNAIRRNTFTSSSSSNSSASNRVSSNSSTSSVSSNSSTSSVSSSRSNSVISNNTRIPPVLQDLWKKDDTKVSEITSATVSVPISSKSTAGTVTGPVVTDAVPIKVEPGRRRRRPLGDSSSAKPVDTSYVEVKTNLFLGDDVVSHSLEKLLTIGITHIICLSESQYYNAEPFKDKFEYKVWNVHDTTKFEIYDLFDPIADYIVATLKKSNSNKILLHCKFGISLSPTVMIAYLMREYFMTLTTAMNTVKNKWSKTKPNSGFMQQLEDFDLDMEDDAAIAGVDRR
jgi:hypothetical protein